MYAVFDSESQKKLYSTKPTFYIWDDHDFGPNDSDESNPGREAATLVYRDFVPYIALKTDIFTVYKDSLTQNAAFQNLSNLHASSKAGPDELIGIYTATLIGRVMMIVWDARSFKIIS